jgi:Mrp family chromosome partitioning ATPase
LVALAVIPWSWAASLSVWNAERAAGGAEWSPFVRRRQCIDQRARDRRKARLVARPRDHKLATPALGIALDGDLTGWRHGRYVVPPAHLRGKAMAVVGAPGAGKTVTLLRLAYLAARAGRKVCFADGKAPTPPSCPG